MTGQAVDRRGVGVHPGVTRDAISHDIVTRKAGPIRSCLPSGRGDERLVAAAFGVRFSIAVARFADRVWNGIALRLSMSVRIRAKRFRLVGVAVAARHGGCRLLG
jgi:hypothetical protein